ncbi:MAG: hypothetical protein ACUVWO_17405 [Thermodesulfobacteriota bacterium]
MLMIKKGVKLKSLFTGKIYGVKAIRDRMVVLESENGSSQVLTEKSNLDLFYQPAREEDKG